MADEREWLDACLFLSKGPSLAMEFLDEEARVMLWAYWEQALEGPAEELSQEQGMSDERARKRREARRRLGEMPKSEARRKLVGLMSSVVPEWREWCREHGERIREEQRSGGEAQKLLRAFSLKTGIKLSPKL